MWDEVLGLLLFLQMISLQFRKVKLILASTNNGYSKQYNN